MTIMLVATTRMKTLIMYNQTIDSIVDKFKQVINSHLSMGDSFYLDFQKISPQSYAG